MSWSVSAGNHEQCRAAAQELLGAPHQQPPTAHAPSASSKLNFRFLKNWMSLLSSFGRSTLPSMLSGTADSGRPPNSGVPAGAATCCACCGSAVPSVVPADGNASLPCSPRAAGCCGCCCWSCIAAAWPCCPDSAATPPVAAPAPSVAAAAAVVCRCCGLGSCSTLEGSGSLRK